MQNRIMADNTATLDEVAAFLKEFHQKAKIFGIIYNNDKEENMQTLFDLELPPDKRDEYILNLLQKTIIKALPIMNMGQKKDRYGCLVLA